jgi:hypothetical protein
MVQCLTVNKKFFAPLFYKKAGRRRQAKMVKKTRLMVDGHVHIYDCFNLEKFFKIAVTWLDHYYNTLYANGSPYVNILLLTEGKTNDFFSQLKKNHGFPNDSGYRVLETAEEESIILAKDDQPQCYILKGRQIVTGENLEVLAVATDRYLEDGLPIETVLEALTESRTLTVLAWGVGKWLFKRGKIIEGIIDRNMPPYLMVGDNSGRPGFWSFPGLFKRARAFDIPLLSGSDPLPFEKEIYKVGSYGFSVEGDFNPEEPAGSLRDILVSPGIYEHIDRFGQRDNIISFFRRQSKIYLKKYIKRRAQSI